MKKILLDTNAYTHLLAGDQDVLNTLAAAETVYMSIFVLGELYAGFSGDFKEKENKSQGTPLPINDVWIAAHGIETGSTVLTFDSHFKKIPGLLLWNLI